MTDLGKYWASASSHSAKFMLHNAKTASLHRLDIAGVASSILATPTMMSWISSDF